MKPASVPAKNYTSQRNSRPLPNIDFKDPSTLPDYSKIQKEEQSKKYVLENQRPRYSALPRSLERLSSPNFVSQEIIYQNKNQVRQEMTQHPGQKIMTSYTPGFSNPNLGYDKTKPNYF